MTPRLSELGQAAVEYARCGWPVFPLLPRQKAPIHAGGFHNATTDLQLAEQTWRQHPRANIGAPCGVAFDVIDVDGPTGERSLAELADGRALEAPEVSTGREDGGRHLYVLPTGLRRRPGFRPKLDYLGLGGYVVLPPSVHPTGAIYRWRRPVDGELPVVPSWLLEALEPPMRAKTGQPATEGLSEAYGAAVMAREMAVLVAAREGTRNEELNRVSFRFGQLIGVGLLNETDARNQLTWAGGRIGLPESEIDSVVGRSIEQGKKSPRGSEIRGRAS